MARNHDLKECQEIIDIFYQHGHRELDTARVYGGGTSELVCVFTHVVLFQGGRKFILDFSASSTFHSSSCEIAQSIQSKLHIPLTGSSLFLNIRQLIRAFPTHPGAFSPEKIRETLSESLKALKRDKVRVFYLHAPDRSVPFEDTLREVNALYKEGKLWVDLIESFFDV